MATRSLDELTIDLLADEAVFQRAVADLIEQTAPPPGGAPLERLLASVAAYANYVVENLEGYASIVKAAQGGNESLRALYESARTEELLAAIAGSLPVLVDLVP